MPPFQKPTLFLQVQINNKYLEHRCLGCGFAAELFTAVLAEGSTPDAPAKSATPVEIW